MNYSIEATQIRNTINHAVLLKKTINQKSNQKFVVNTNDLCFYKTALKNDIVNKANVVIKPDDDTDMKDKENIGESEDRCDGQQMTTRRSRKKAAEEADLKIKHCH